MPVAPWPHHLIVERFPLEALETSGQGSSRQGRSRPVKGRGRRPSQAAASLSAVLEAGTIGPSSASGPSILTCVVYWVGKASSRDRATDDPVAEAGAQ